VRTFIDLVAPLRCVACAEPGPDELCARCATRVRVLVPPWCDRCGTPQPAPTARCSQCASLGSLDRARSLVAFAEPSRRLTLQLKRRGRNGLAHAIGGLLALLADREGLVTDATVVTWVPAGRSSRAKGFDHARLVAIAVASELGRPAAALVHRAADGPRQADVPLQRRRENVAGRFAARPVATHVLVVDDVFTTGATAEACAAALKTAGASAVDVVTWARTPRLRPA
jgi:predicted amidophosphoribosyltransferase